MVMTPKRSCGISEFSESSEARNSEEMSIASRQAPILSSSSRADEVIECEPAPSANGPMRPYGMSA